ncbi:MAG: hypothetical protein JW884_02650 [Deltaproteobacteria bacterium]|nr:hypothetical protein [Deltaproteobacteria bacterium]
MTVVLSAEAVTEKTTTRNGGRYAFTVASGWRGEATPSLSGYYFSPQTAILGPLQADVIQDFLLAPLHAKLSRFQNPLAGCGYFSYSGRGERTASHDRKAGRGVE